MRILYLSLAVASLALPSVLNAQSTPRTNIEMRGTVPLSPDLDSSYTPRRDVTFRAWKEGQDARSSHSYEMTLRFAECVARFDKAAASRVLHSSLRSIRSGNDLGRISMMNRGCVVEYAKVHPVLLRAALAETQLRNGAAEPGVATVGQSPVGLPEVVDGYRIRDVAECQVRSSPALVRGLLATKPGEMAERRAAEALFLSTAECGTAVLGRLSPTAARLAVVEAEYMRRFVAGRSSR